MRSRFAICALFMLLVLSAIAPASGRRVDGSILKADVTPGEHIRHEMTLKIGEDEQAVDAKADIMGFGTNINGGNDYVVPDNDTSPYSARTFLKIEPESVHLEPGVPVKVILEGDVPEDVGSGGRYAIINIHTIPQGSGTVGFATSILVPIYLKINGTDLVMTGEITGINVSNDGVLSISFENTGNYHYGVSAEVLLKDEGDNIVKSVSSKNGTALPAVPYPFTISLNPEGDLTSGTYAIEAKVIRRDGTVLDTEDANFKV